MCTVTVLPRARLLDPAEALEPRLLRVACNRDERRSRPSAIPPSAHVVDGRRVVMPIDPESGGTWIAATDAGLVLVVLNVNAGDAPASGALSRGGLIPRLCGAAGVTDALARALAAGVERYSPFRLMVLDRYQLAECWLEHGRVHQRRAYLQSPILRTSSSLGDAVVDGPRRSLFRQFFERTTSGAAAQDAFHDHQWPGREAVSVRMRREDAATVSQTTVELSPGVAAMSYRPAGAAMPVRIAVPLAPFAQGDVRRCS
jgi:hypothetical protein